MRRANPWTLALAALLSSLSLGAPALAEISPENVRRLKDRASEQLRVEVRKVETSWRGWNRQRQTVHAVVTEVTKSGSGVKKGATIKFRSERAIGPVLAPGPRNPPYVRKGWKGTVWLKSTGGTYGIAVAGHSFEPE